MGAWGTGAFDNDMACDWAASLIDFNDLALVKDAIGAVLEMEDEYLDAYLASEALAACEVLAGLKEKPRAPAGDTDAIREALGSYTEEVHAWIEAHPINPPGELLEQAVKAIDRIVSPDSELLELWKESKDLEEWRASVADLRARVAG